MGGFLKDFLGGTEGAAAKKNEANAAILMGTLGTQYGYGQAQLLKGIAGIEAGYASAQGMLDKQGVAASNQILASQKQTVASQTQGLVSKGLYNTSVAGNLANQAQTQASQQFLQLHEQLGAQQAGLETQKAGALNSSYQNLAQYAMGKVGAQANITPQYTGSQGALGGILSAVGSIYGAG